MSAQPRTTAAVQELVARLAPDQVHTSGTAYEATRRVRNGAAPTSPALVVHAHGQEDVRAAVLAARRHGLLAAKARFDPDGVFTATPLPTAASTAGHASWIL
ncbi:hypothetical protein [Streptomyces sp. NPDC059861]|uniref:hypothetical protein n=1 Tax=Streptomyces sp. NPDC059861 TaxID=3346974 RepID=UPI00365E9816